MDYIKDMNYKLNIPKDVVNYMKEKYILEDHVKKVIYYSIKTKERFFNPFTLQYVARLKLDNIAYWVRYEDLGKEICVKSVIAVEWKLMYYSWSYNLPIN
ncbi:MAG: pyridine nucleotide-disulfide oxidoreductase [Anaerocolumna sp.]|jgi:hypothetical protein|nr:pyridine nucleotide-disulfide oxidoreductase [Anaerocolumna sp.]